MLATKPQITTETSDSAKLELYRLIGEGYKAMQEGRTSTIEEVREKLEKRRSEERRVGKECDSAWYLPSRQSMTCWT